MEKIVLSAPAKINLTLDVLGKRQDGFHEVKMIMQTIDLADTITLVLADETADQTIELRCSNDLVPTNEANLAFKAAKLLQERFKVPYGVLIEIEKNIPIEAGLAGGSTDAAATLKGLNELWKLGLSLEQLMEIGADLGSDVPFCILQGTALAFGRGEKLLPLNPIPQLDIILVKPAFGVSTKEVYSNFSLDKVDTHPKTDEMLKAIEEGNREEIVALGANLLESVTLKLYPEVAKLKKAMESTGLKGVLMSGSGPTVFGFVPAGEDPKIYLDSLESYGRVIHARSYPNS